MASDDSTRRPSSGRWTSSPKGPWTPALNAITSNNTTHRLGVTTINAGPSSSTTPANSDQLTHDSPYEKQALRQARQQRPKKHGRDPNTDIGVLQPIPSTECKGLPPATGVTFTSGKAVELVKRNICGWLEYEKVFEVGGVKVLSGLFGVEKSSTLPDGRCSLRLIMNLIPSNGILKTIQGRVRGLPSITSWLSIAVGPTEEVRFWQSDMCSAFYLFSLPSSWMPLLSFNLTTSGESIGLKTGVTYALACKVLPMGWSSSVAVMQEVAEHYPPWTW